MDGAWHTWVPIKALGGSHASNLEVKAQQTSPLGSLVARDRAHQAGYPIWVTDVDDSVLLLGKRGA
jgi:hypothetical protein